MLVNIFHDLSATWLQGPFFMGKDWYIRSGCPYLGWRFEKGVCIFIHAYIYPLCWHHFYSWFLFVSMTFYPFVHFHLISECFCRHLVVISKSASGSFWFFTFMIRDTFLMGILVCSLLLHDAAAELVTSKVLAMKSVAMRIAFCPWVSAVYEKICLDHHLLVLPLTRTKMSSSFPTIAHAGCPLDFELTHC